MAKAKGNKIQLVVEVEAGVALNERKDALVNLVTSNCPGLISLKVNTVEVAVEAPESEE